MGEILGVTPNDAWTLGTNIRSAMRIDQEHEQAVRMWIVTEVGKLVRDVDANKTLKSDEELTFCCRAIIDDFPALKLEEVRTCFDMVRKGKFGKLYERLKTQEILEALRWYESEVRAPILERHQQNKKYEHLEESRMRLSDVVKETQIADHLTSTGPKREGVGSRLRKHLGTDD